jgi:hypothetical protein
VGNADESDGTSIIKFGVDGSGTPIELKAGVPMSLEEALIKKIPLRHILIENGAAVPIKDAALQTDFRSVNRGKAISNVLAR